MTHKRVLVTGGTRGIGRAIALEFARAGFAVAFTGRTRKEGEGVEVDADDGVSLLPGSLDATAAELNALGAENLPIQMDLLDPISVDATVKTVIDAWGGLDVLVNNAFYETGKYAVAWMKDVPVGEYRRKVEANCIAPFALMQGFLGGMLEQGSGCVINLSTRHNYQDQYARPGEGGASVCYNVSKAAMGKLADGLACEHGRDGIRAFNLDPGPVMTERAERQFEKINYPLEIFCPIDIPAKVALWLATEDEAELYNGTHFMAQEFALQRNLAQWKVGAVISDKWRPGYQLDWMPPSPKGVIPSKSTAGS